jgi:beta-lactamase class A
VNSTKTRVVRWVKLHGWKVGVGLLVVVVLVQLAYPMGRTLPFSRVAGGSAGFASRQQVEDQLKHQFKELQPEVRVDGQLVTKLNLEKMGARLQLSQSSQPVFRYPWWQRMVPFSSLVLHPQANELVVEFDTQALVRALDSQKTVLATNPRNATVSIEEGLASIVSQKPGVKVDTDSLKRTLENAHYTADRAVVLEPKGETTQPRRDTSDASVQAAYQQAARALEKPLQLTYGDGEQDSVEPKVFGAWLEAQEQPDGDIKLAYKEAAIADFLHKKYDEQLVVAPGVTKITTLDGVETGRSTGEVGQEIDGSASAASIGEALLGTKKHSAAIGTKAVAPREEYTRNYTQTPRGVAAYMYDIAQTGDITISIVSDQVNAGAKATQSVTAASTYKLFVAVMVLHKIDAGELKYDDSFTGSTIGGCIDKMIVQSDNPCAEGFIDKLGRKNLNEFFHSRGYSSATTFTDGQSAKTSAADLVKVLGDIDKAKDIKPESRDKLLGFMTRQQFRQGIPAGTGVRVANKVGFLNGVLNDAGIVSHPKGTYYLAITTNGQSWGKIAEITNKIESLLYP